MLSLQKVAQFLLQLVTWWGMIGRDVVVGPCENTSLPITTRHVVSYGKNCETYCGFSITPTVYIALYLKYMILIYLWDPYVVSVILHTSKILDSHILSMMLHISNTLNSIIL